MVSKAAKRSNKKTKSSDFVLNHGLDDVVVNIKKRGFSEWWPVYAD